MCRAHAWNKRCERLEIMPLGKRWAGLTLPKFLTDSCIDLRPCSPRLLIFSSGTTAALRAPRAAPKLS